MSDLAALIASAARLREGLVDPDHRGAFRLLAGFREGAPDLVLDVYGRTLVVHDHGDVPSGQRARAASEAARAVLPWLGPALWKARHARDARGRNGQMLLGRFEELDREMEEHGVRYALDLGINRDTSFYLDTRGLRAWAKEALGGKKVLNTFAYTGTLGVAARAAGAAQVVQLEKSRAFLEVARASYRLNGFEAAKGELRAGDFFDHVARLRRDDLLFDCVFLDPPFFAASPRGTVDLQAKADRVVNKVRPLVAHGGALVVVNNALFLPGAEWIRSLEALCQGGWLSVEKLIPVPDDVAAPAGAASGEGAQLPADPAPFNHPTKIAILRVRRKDERGA